MPMWFWASVELSMECLLFAERPAADREGLELVRYLLPRGRMGVHRVRGAPYPVKERAFPRQVICRPNDEGVYRTRGGHESGRHRRPTSQTAVQGTYLPRSNRAQLGQQ